MRKLLRILLTFLRANGVDPRYQNWFSKCLQLISLLSGFYLIILYFAEIAFNWQGVQSLAKISMLPSIFMFMVKSSTLQQRNKHLLEIAKMTESFPKSETFGNEVHKQLEKIFNYAQNATLVFFTICLFCMIAFGLIPFITDDRTLMFNGYETCDLYTSPCFEIKYAIETILSFWIFIPTVVSFDCLFIHFVAEAYYVIEATKQMLGDIVTEGFDKKQIGGVVKVHVHGLCFIKELNRFYSSAMASQLCFSLGGLILDLYMMTSEGIPPPIHLLTKYGFVYLVLSSQLFFYCFGGAIIMEQSKTVADTAYGIDWWSETRPELRKALSLIIERSQKFEKITAGNVMNLNLESFVAVLKNSVSVYTLLLTMETKANMMQQ